MSEIIYLKKVLLSKFTEKKKKTGLTRLSKPKKNLVSSLISKKNEKKILD
ncbi:MAG: hypothetical protein LBF57_02035 [Holosporaceae bacterium]|jgi:hypothetical protein|nr:hypothetical protein [Holosporaceae bacterium]